MVDSVLEVQNIKLPDSGGVTSSTAITLDANGNVTLSGTANNIGTATGTFNGTLGTACESNFQRINANYKIQRYFSSISLPNSTWTTLVDVDDIIANYSHSFQFNGDRFIATTYIYGANPGTGVVMWGVESQVNAPFTDIISWHSASAYSVSFRCVYNSATSIELQMYNNTGYGPWIYHAVTEFWYYDY